MFKSSDYYKNLLAFASLCFLIVGLFFYFYARYYPLSDWSVAFHPAAQDLLSFKNVYASDSYSFFYPIWVLLPLTPLALLPVRLANTLVALLCIAVLAYVALRRAACPLPLALFLFMPQTLFLAANGDFVDAFTALGFVLPPQVGLFLILAKPQTGLAVALFWLVEAWRNGKLREVVRVFAPVSIAFGLSWLLFSPNQFRPLLNAPNLVGMGAPHDANIWPYGVILGLVLITWAIRSRRIGPAILASICFSPYVGFYSWPPALLGALPSQWEFVVLTAAMYLLGYSLTHY